MLFAEWHVVAILLLYIMYNIILYNDACTSQRITSIVVYCFSSLGTVSKSHQRHVFLQARMRGMGRNTMGVKWHHLVFKDHYEQEDYFSLWGTIIK